MSRGGYLCSLVSLSLGLFLSFNNCGQEWSLTTAPSLSLDIECAVSTGWSKLSKKVYKIPSDSEVSLLVTPPSGDWTNTSSDALRSQQIYLDVLAVDQAHQIIYDGIPPSIQPVVAAVIDSGVDHTHPDLVHQIYRKDGQMVGYDFYNRDTDPMDDNGHGTHVAGLIAAEGHNGVGVRGGAPEHVKIMPIKILNHRGSLPVERFEDMSQAVRFAVDKGADLINMSLGMTVKVAGFDEKIFASLKAALEYAVHQGVVVVIASGNDNIELNDVRMTYPAKFGAQIDGVITVGAYDATVKTISPFSNFSPVYVEMQAPGSMNSGQGLISTYPGSDYKYMPGTSMATPLVAGLVALTKLYLRKKNLDLTASQIENLIRESSIQYQSLVHLAQKGRVINYKSMADSLVRIYESGIIGQPKNLRLKEGQTGRLAVKVSHYSSKLQFQWYHNGQMLPGADQIELLLKNVTHEDGGDYHVKVRFESGDEVHSLKGKVEVFSENSCG